MITRGLNLTVMSLLLFGVVFAGCAKRPATTSVSAPAPTASAATAPGAPPTAAGPAPTAPGGAAVPSAATARPSPAEFMAVDALKDVHFDFDKYDIRPGDAKILDANASWLKSNAGMLVLIEGHCD